MDITQAVARIVVNGKDLPFTSVRTTVINGPANDLIVTTKQRVNELYRFMWSRVPVMLTMYFI
ncbi:group-specific protein [Bacillus cereus]|nr:group-specific protein [Bacillus cereus]